MPSWYSIRLWLLKVGLFKLTQPKEIADDWIWIADHSVQIGADKCLVILGIRAKDLPKGRALTLCDVEPLAVIPTKLSNRKVVFDQLSQIAHITGVPYAIVSDAGSDLKAGIDDYCDFIRYRTRHIYDITHWVALQLKTIFESDKSWLSFIEYCSTAQQYMRQTEVAALSPPNQRSKARYLNIGIIIRWAQKIQLLLESKDKIQSIFDTELVTKSLSWIQHFKSDIHEWGEIVDIAMAVKHIINTEGVHRYLARKIDQELNKLPCSTSRVVTFRNTMIHHAESLQYKADIGTRLPGCSDVVESLFGQFKRIEQQQAGGGFTQLLLAIPALVGKKSAELVKQAMESIRVKDVSNWFKDNVGMSVQGKRKLAFDGIELTKKEVI